VTAAASTASTAALRFRSGDCARGSGVLTSVIEANGSGVLASRSVLAPIPPVLEPPAHALAHARRGRGAQAVADPGTARVWKGMTVAFLGAMRVSPPAARRFW
jgi:hypothetical protein